MTDRTERIELTNMVMVEDGAGNVLVEKRVKPGWSGLVFPGGHVERQEKLTDSAIREVFEETGLTIEQPRLIGVQQFAYADGHRYLVFLFKAHRFNGAIHGSEEGDVVWMPLEELKTSTDRMPRYFESILQVFLSEEITEYALVQSRDDEKEWTEHLV